MKCKVQLYVAGKVFDEIVIARDYEEAKQVALARNPNATVIGVTAVFRIIYVLPTKRLDEFYLSNKRRFV